MSEKQWFGVVNRTIIDFSEAFILPGVRSYVHPFLQIILVLNIEEDRVALSCTVRPVLLINCCKGNLSYNPCV